MLDKGRGSRLAQDWEEYTSLKISIGRSRLQFKVEEILLYRYSFF